MIIIFCHPISLVFAQETHALISFCQLLTIIHCFDEGMETKATFLDLSKAFGKVWHKGLIYKLRQYGFTGNLLTLLTDILSNRKERVVLNDQHSSWADIEGGVPQGSVLEPLFFLIYINDLTENLHSNPKLFLDDTSLF